VNVWLGVFLYCYYLKNNPVVVHVNDFVCVSQLTTASPFKTEKECKEESEKNHYGKARCIKMEI